MYNYVVLSDHVTNSTYVRHKRCTVLMCHSLEDGKTLVGVVSGKCVHLLYQNKQDRLPLDLQRQRDDKLCSIWTLRGLDMHSLRAILDNNQV